MQDVIKTSLNFDIERLRLEVSNLIEVVGLHTHHNQICLTHTRHTQDDWYEGCGSLTYTYTQGLDVYANTSGLTNADFCVFNKTLDNTYIHTVYNEVMQHAPFGRFRIMALPHKKCMSWHNDSTPRLHLPVYSNDKCRLVIEDTAHTMEADGSVYWCDTRKYHTAFNSDPSLLRVHLLFDLIN